MDETWFSRDLLVLQAIVKLADDPERFFVDNESVEVETGLDETTVQVALRALAYESPSFAKFSARTASGEIDMIDGVTGHARRTVGQWPMPKTDAAEQVAAIVEAFKQAEDDAPDETSKSKIRALGETFKGLPASVSAAVAGAAFLKMTGLG